jgi:hypothetical protein
MPTPSPGQSVFDLPFFEYEGSASGRMAHSSINVSRGTLFPKRVQPTMLSTSSTHRIRALAEAVFSNEGVIPSTHRLNWLMDEINDFLTKAGALSRTSYLAALYALTSSAPLFVASVKPFHKLSLAKRVTALQRVENSPISGTLFASKALLCLLYYEHPEVGPEVGFDGHCLKGKPSQ